MQGRWLDNTPPVGQACMVSRSHALEIFCMLAALSSNGFRLPISYVPLSSMDWQAPKAILSAHRRQITSIIRFTLTVVPIYVGNSTSRTICLPR